MSCRCGLADECNGEHATFYPLQYGGMCAVVPCYNPVVLTEEQIRRINEDYRKETYETTTFYTRTNPRDCRCS